MFLPLTIYFHGRRYELRLSWRSSQRSAGRVLSRGEAERVLAEVMRSADCAALRELYMEVAHCHSIVHISNQQVLRGLVARLDGGDGFGDFSVVEMDPFERGKPRTPAQPESKEEQHVDKLLTELGPADLHHRGDLYRVVRAPKNDRVADRHRYEVIDRREARTVLQAMAGEGARPDRQKAALSELAAHLDKPRVEPDAQVLVLRRIRTYARPPGEDSGPITPSQLRRARETHWVEICLVDKRLGPLAGETFDITLPDGRKRQAVTNKQGLYRVDNIPAGSCRIQFRPAKGHPPKSADTEWNKLELGTSVSTDEQHKLEVDHNQAEIVEVDDAQFCANSSVLVPNDSAMWGVNGLSMAAHALRYASENANRKLMIVGHADSQEGARAALAAKRAKALEAILKGDAKAFVAACVDPKQAATPILLDWAVDRHGYRCYPKAPVPTKPDAKQGKTDPVQAALVRFRKEHNKREKTHLDQTAQGMVAADYEAFFKLYERTLADQLDIEPSELASARSKLKFHSVPTLGAESEWPKPAGAGSKQLRSRSSRRVDLMFLENDHPIPKLDDTAVSAEHFFVDERRVRRSFVPPRGAIVVVTPYTDADINKGVDAAFKLVGPGYSSTIKLSERSKHAKDHFDVKYTELEFNLIPIEGKYKLSVTPKGGAESVVFENVPFAELLDDGAADGR